jgi:hypothetical protein
MQPRKARGCDPAFETPVEVTLHGILHLVCSVSADDSSVIQEAEAVFGDGNGRFLITEGHHQLLANLVCQFLFEGFCLFTISYHNHEVVVEVDMPHDDKLPFGPMEKHSTGVTLPNR